jgi:hypothetical protein
MRAGWGVLAVCAAATLAGCGQSKATEFAQCRFDAFKEFSRLEDGEEAYNKQGDYIMLCMEAKGYAVKWDGPCKRSSAVMTAHDEGCYLKGLF